MFRIMGRIILLLACREFVEFCVFEVILTTDLSLMSTSFIQRELFCLTERLNRFTIKMARSSSGDHLLFMLNRAPSCFAT